MIQVLTLIIRALAFWVGSVLSLVSKFLVIKIFFLMKLLKTNKQSKLLLNSYLLNSQYPLSASSW